VFDIFEPEAPVLDWPRARKILDSVVPKRSSLPILQCVHVVGSGNRLTITATDLDLAAIVTVTNDRKIDGAHVFLWSEFKAGIVPTDKLQTWMVEDYPTLPEADGDDVGVDWVGGAKACIPCVSTNQSRLSLNGVCVQAIGCTATDGHRLTHVAGSHKVAEMIVPPKLLSLLTDDPTEAKATDRTLSVSYPWGRLVSKVIEGPYPNWPQIVPKQDASCPTLTMNRNDLREVCHAAKQLRKDGGKVKVAEGSLWIENQDGAYIKRGECIAAFEGHAFAFNASYMWEFCMVATGDKITLTQADPLRPITINRDKPGIRILMPLRLAEV
jgi:DNA polymerase III sliding clamp (beta) subunit (PCNA family)